MSRKKSSSRKKKTWSFRVLDIAALGFVASRLFGGDASTRIQRAIAGDNPGANLMLVGQGVFSNARTNAIPLAIGLGGYALARQVIPKVSFKVPAVPLRVGV